MKLLSLGLLLLLIVPLTASADNAYTTARVNLRTGPDRAYPHIVTLPASASVDIYGCIDDWSWCDVGWRSERGWIYGGLLDYSYQGQRYEIYGYGPELGLPILSFVLDSYWDNHYRGRAWYGERSRWSQHRPVYRPRPSQPRRIQDGRSTNKSSAQPARPATRPATGPASAPNKQEDNRDDDRTPRRRESDQRNRS